MKQLLFLLLITTAIFAGRKDISMLNQQILALEDQNRSLKDDNKALEDSNKLYEEKVTKLDTEIKLKNDTITTLNKQLIELQKQLKNAREAAANCGQTSNNNQPVHASKFPITAQLMTKKVYDATSLAVLISFMNQSPEAIAGFSARLVFMEGTQQLLDCNVDVNKSIGSGESVTWYGAIPYNSTDGNNVRFYGTEPSAITVAVEVTSVTLTNGVVRSYK